MKRKKYKREEKRIRNTFYSIVIIIIEYINEKLLYIWKKATEKRNEKKIMFKHFIKCF